VEGKMMNTVRFLSLLFAALVLAPALAHLLELPNKIEFPRDEYLTVQQIYRGWALLGFIVAGALCSTLALTIMTPGRSGTFAWSLTAFVCIAGNQVVFWTSTYPANQLTNNWTALPDNWMALRKQWEYSHATSAALNLLALAALISSALARDGSAMKNSA
jgi:hypothetical protein